MKYRGNSDNIHLNKYKLDSTCNDNKYNDNEKR